MFDCTSKQLNEWCLNCQQAYTMLTFRCLDCCFLAGLDKTAEVQRKVLKDDDAASELTLKCHVEGNPEPTIVWSRNKERYVTNHSAMQVDCF